MYIYMNKINDDNNNKLYIKSLLKVLYAFTVEHVKNLKFWNYKPIILLLLLEVSHYHDHKIYETL